MADDIRTRILDAAIRLLEKEGSKGFGQTRVSREAGVQQGHLTYYFPKKADLVAGVLERLSEKARKEFERFVARASELGGRERHELFFSHVRTLMMDKRRTRIVLGLAAEAGDDPELAALLAEKQLGQRPFVAVLLGREPDDPDVELALATLRGLGIQHLLQGGDAGETEVLIERFRRWLEVLPPRSAVTLVSSPT